MTFSPNLTPKEVIQLGSFGGVYFHNKDGEIDIDYKEFPSNWFEGLEDYEFKSPKYYKKVNFFKIKSGLSQEEWEKLFLDGGPKFWQFWREIIVKNVFDRNFERIKTNGIELNVVVEGAGPLIILLHGFPQSAFTLSYTHLRLPTIYSV